MRKNGNKGNQGRLIEALWVWECILRSIWWWGLRLQVLSLGPKLCRGESGFGHAAGGLGHLVACIRAGQAVRLRQGGAGEGEPRSLSPPENTWFFQSLPASSPCTWETQEQLACLCPWVVVAIYAEINRWTAQPFTGLTAAIPVRCQCRGLAGLLHMSFPMMELVISDFAFNPLNYVYYFKKWK